MLYICILLQPFEAFLQPSAVFFLQPFTVIWNHFAALCRGLETEVFSLVYNKIKNNWLKNSNQIRKRRLARQLIKNVCSNI